MMTVRKEKNEVKMNYLIFLVAVGTNDDVVFLLCSERKKKFGQYVKLFKNKFRSTIPL